jgi:hypothetical protein
MNTQLRTRGALIGIAATAAGVVLATAGGAAEAAASPSATSASAVTASSSAKHPVTIEVFAPERHSVAGIEGKGWFVRHGTWRGWYRGRQIPAHETELWDTWIDDAPDVVQDVNRDGRVDAKDLQAMGVASNIVTVPFHINGAGA